MPVFTDYEMEMPKAEGWLHIEVYFMQFMWIAEYYYWQKKKINKKSVDISTGLCSVWEIIAYTHEIFFTQNILGQVFPQSGNKVLEIKHCNWNSYQVSVWNENTL